MFRAVPVRHVLRRTRPFLQPQPSTTVASVSSSSAACSGVITKCFPERGFAIVQDALQRDHLFRFADAPSAATHDGLPATRWPVGIRVVFNSVERPNQASDRRYVAEDVCEEPASVRENIVQHVLTSMEDPAWDLVLAMDVSNDDRLDGAHRRRNAVSPIPTGYDMRYLVLNSDLTLGPGGIDALTLNHTEHPLERFRRELDEFDPLVEGG